MASDSGPATGDCEPFEVMGIRMHVDPTLPPDRIEIRDAVTGEVRAYWGEHGIFEVHSPTYPRRNVRWATTGTEADPIVANFAEPLPSITCPRCGRTSYNPNDIREGYCGNCHGWTGEDRR